VSTQGVTLETHTFGNYVFRPAYTFPNIPAAATSAPASGWDYVVVTTKALPDVLDDSLAISPLVSAGTTIVLVQNGVGIEEPHRKRFPTTPIVSAVTIISAEQISQGTVRQNRWTRISLGPYTNGLGTRDEGAQQTKEFGDILTLGGIRDAEVHTEIELQTIRWHKICINAAMNPSAVLSGGLGNAAMSMEPELRRHLLACMYEIFDAAPRILGQPFPEGLAKPELILKSTERNSKGRPSMLVDWEQGRPMELEVILGNPVRIARERGVDLPRLQSIYALLRSAQTERNKSKSKSKI
jgi:2-dehydropantoate 2-reductase